MEVGVGHCNIALILLMFGPTPWKEMIWPRYSIDYWTNKHLVSLRKNLSLDSVRNTNER